MSPPSQNPPSLRPPSPNPPSPAPPSPNPPSLRPLSPRPPSPTRLSPVPPSSIPTSASTNAPGDRGHAPDGALRWTAERFYWAALDAPGVTGAGPLPPGLLTDLAEQVPVAIEELHAVYARAGEQLVVCAARRTDLEVLGPGCRSLHPAELPPGLCDDPGAAARLNLLVGAFEPLVARRARTRRDVLRLATALLLIALITAGFVRRAAHWDGVAADARDAAQRLVERHALASADPQAVGAELAKVQMAAMGAAAARPAPDAALALCTLLKAWPASVPCKPQSIGVTESGVTVSILVEGDPSEFLRAFTPPPGWTMNEPRLNNTGTLTRVAIDLRPIETAPKGTP